MLDLTLIVYCIVFIIGCFNVYSNTKLSNSFFFFCIFLLSAFRFDVGYDFPTYYNVIKDNNIFEINRFEPAERLLIILSQKTDPQIFFIINSFISVYFTKWALQKLSLNLSLSGLAYLCLPNMFLYDMNVIRYASALSIIFYASTFIYENKYLIYIALIIFATLFHQAAIIGLLYFPLIKINLPFFINFIILAIGVIGGNFLIIKIITLFSFQNSYSEEFISYAIRDGSSGMNKIPYFYLFIDIVILLLYKKFFNKKLLYKFLTIFNIGVTFIFLFKINATLATRLSLPFLSYLLILIPYFLNYDIIKWLKRKKGYIQLIIFGFCFIFYIYFITIYNESLGRSQYLPYKIFFL